MRLFTAIDLPEDVTGGLNRLLERLKPLAPIKWSPVENMHLTTKFIGEWPSERLEELIAALRLVPPRMPFAIRLRTLGWFPNERAPRVLWVGIEAGPSLGNLARLTEANLASLGVPVEKRAFTPHLTLARIKAPTALEELRKTVSALADTDFGEFRAERFHLYRSEMRPAGSVYTRLETFPFQLP